MALSHWTDLFLDVINKHAPLKKKAGETPNPSTLAEHWYKASHVIEGQMQEAKEICRI